MAKPTAVITGDLHFTPATLELATSAWRQAEGKALALGVPLVINGDTLDTKTIMRGECVNRLVELLAAPKVKVYVNVGNHEKISEKGKEHTLHFLKPYCTVIDTPTFVPELKAYIIPYEHDSDLYLTWLASCTKSKTLIVHQGVQTAFLGHYVQDTSSLPVAAFAPFRVIGSHYHRYQDTHTGPELPGRVGVFSYVGSGYTTSFGEAEDGPKGFCVLYDDGTLEVVPTNLRKHVKIDVRVEELQYEFSKDINPGDLVWVKITGPSLQLQALKKPDLAKILGLHSENFKLDLVPTDSKRVTAPVGKGQTESEVMDALIDASPESDTEKAVLKAYYREVLR